MKIYCASFVNKLTQIGVGLFLILGINYPLSAQSNFPSKPLRLVVPFPPGGSADILARVIGQKLGDILEQTVLVDNKAGASGAIATDFVAKSNADGYTLIFATASTQVINPAFSKVPFDPVQDFTPVGMIGLSPLGLVVNPDVPGSGVQDLLTWLRANPGKVNMASFGNMTVSHLAGELFMLNTNTRMLHVPYKGAQPGNASAAFCQTACANSVGAMVTTIGFLR